MKSPIHRVLFSCVLSFIIVSLIFAFQASVFLTADAQSTFLNKQAQIILKVPNKEKTTFDIQTRRVKVHDPAWYKDTNEILLTSKMTYINRERKLQLTIRSDNPSKNNLILQFSSPEIISGESTQSAKMLYTNITIDGKIIQENRITDSRNPFEYEIKNISNDTPVSISFKARKPILFRDICFIKIVCLFLLIATLIFFYNSIQKSFYQLQSKLTKKQWYISCSQFLDKILFHFSYRKILLISTIFYTLFFIISYLTPFHSDDWTQTMDGVSLAQICHIWMTWSGRLVADTVARSLLQLHEYPIVLNLLRSVVPILVCGLIVLIPSKITGKKTSPLSFVLTIFLYWICNSNLGQTTFWIVGSANYLWTNLFVLLFIYTYIATYNKTQIAYRVLLFVLALCAGCSNEHTALTFPFLMLGAGYLLKKQYPKERTINTRIAIISCIIGGILLLGAPGNFVRMQTETEMLSFWRKIGKGIERLLRHFASFRILFILIAISGVLSYKKLKIDFKKPQPFLWAVLFILSGCIAAGVMILSPSASARTFNNTLIFLLVGLSFFNQSLDKYKFYKILAGFVSGIIFIYSYFLVFYSYRATFYQQEIRLSIIDYYRAQGQKEITIPEFYFPKLRSETDMFDRYHNEIGMGRYFGVEKIILNRNISFDYSVLKTGTKIKPKMPILGVELIASVSLLGINGTLIAVTNNPNKRVDLCTVQVGYQKFHFSQPIEVSGKYVFGISVPEFNPNQHPVVLECPF